MDSPTTNIADRRAAWIAGSLLTLVACFYLVRGMPWVYVDDLAFASAAIALAHTGQLVNPAMAGWLATFGTDKFYIQLPFSSYSLAGWICLFGASTRSFIIFTWISYLAGGFGLMRMLGRFGVPAAARLLPVAAYLTYLIQLGFRPEAEASGCLFLGLAVAGDATSFARRLAAMLLLGFGVLAYPMTAGLAVPFVIALLSAQRPEDVPLRPWLRETARVWLPPTALAAGVVVAAFLAMIHFELGLFWSVFSRHRAMRAMSEGTLGGFVRLITEHQEFLLTLPVVLLLPGAGLVAAARWRQVEQPGRLLVFACVAAGAGCVALYAAKAILWVELMAFCAAGAVATSRIAARFRWTAVAGLAGLFAWSQSLWIINAVGRRFPDPAALHAVRDAGLRSGKALVLDASTARYVFDFQLPARIGALGYTQPWSGVPALALPGREGDACWIVTAPILVTWVPDLPAADHEYPRLRLGPHTFNSMPLRPDDPLVIP